MRFNEQKRSNAHHNCIVSVRSGAHGYSSRRLAANSGLVWPSKRLREVVALWCLASSPAWPQASLVGDYAGSYQIQVDGSNLDIRIAVSVDSVEGDVVKGTATSASSKCAGDYPFQGTLNGNQLIVRSTTRRGDCGFGFSGYVEGDALVGSMGRNELPMRVTKLKHRVTLAKKYSANYLGSGGQTELFVLNITSVDKVMVTATFYRSASTRDGGYCAGEYRLAGALIGDELVLSGGSQTRAGWCPLRLQAKVNGKQLEAKFGPFEFVMR
jgi:hypothetical protein